MTKAYWNKLGVELPDFLTDDGADKLVRLILGDLEWDWDDQKRDQLAQLEMLPTMAAANELAKGLRLRAAKARTRRGSDRYFREAVVQG